MPNGYSDLSGIFFIQQQYLADLSALSQTAGGATASYITQLRSDLSNIYNTYKSASPSANAILDKQADMLNIINNENTRLDSKLNTVNSALFGQNRMAEFSSSYSKKYYAQIKILFIVIIILLVYLALSFIDNFIPIPLFIFQFIMLIVGGGGLFIIALIMRDINKRYHMDFDKLNFTPPPGSGDSTSGSSGSGKLNLGSMLCVGEACCPPGNPTGAYWDPAIQQCVSTENSGSRSGVSGFTLMSQTDCKNNISKPVVNNEIKPFEPSEIGKYSKNIL